MSLDFRRELREDDVINQIFFPFSVFILQILSFKENQKKIQYFSLLFLTPKKKKIKINKKIILLYLIQMTTKITWGISSKQPSNVARNFICVRSSHVLIHRPCPCSKTSISHLESAMVITSFYFDNSTRLSNEMNSLTMERRRTKDPELRPSSTALLHTHPPTKIEGKVDDIKWE